jgi:ribose 5-phosphate isomerase A
MNFKKEAAGKAVTLIKNNSTIGLGAGSTMAFMVEILQEEIRNGLAIKIVTPSFNTRQLLQKKCFNVLSTASVEEVDIYFDGCDQVDKNLNALKSGGGIHTHEKLLASMANEFILVGDEGKYVDRFDSRFPLVIEVLPDALRFVTARVQLLFFNVLTALRIGDKKDGAVVTDNGNYLIDLWFQDWPELSDLNTTLKSFTGVVETSLFYNLARKAVISGTDGVRILEVKSG